MSLGVFIPYILIILASYLLWQSCANFDRYSKVIGSRLTQGVRGATINAIGSSLPEFFTTFFFLIILQDVEGFSSGLATILGSAIFNILLIPAIVIFILIKFNHNLKINKKLIFRDTGILLVSQISLLYFIQDGVIGLLAAFYLFLIYLAYLLMLSMVSPKRSNLTGLPPPAGNTSIIPPLIANSPGSRTVPVRT